MIIITICTKTIITIYKKIITMYKNRIDHVKNTISVSSSDENRNSEIPVNSRSADFPELPLFILLESFSSRKPLSTDTSLFVLATET